MTYVVRYKTPDGFDDIQMSSDGEALTGLWFCGAPDEAKHGVAQESLRGKIFRETCRWLDLYFSGHEPGFTPRYRIDGLTPFRREVVEEMLKIPFGATATYGDIAATIAKRRGMARMSARAVGGAVGWNPICLIIPCHRVIGANGAITGYGGGIHNKIALLKHEAMLKRGESRRRRDNMASKASIPGFACRQCGACCRIRDGIVRVSDSEIARIAAFLGVAEQAFIDRETEVAPDRRGLILKSRPDGACVWLTDDNRCRIHPVKPDKCRTFPHEWTNADSHEVCPGLTV